jgi:hypothetical protein
VHAPGLEHLSAEIGSLEEVVGQGSILGVAEYRKELVLEICISTVEGISKCGSS